MQLRNYSNDLVNFAKLTILCILIHMWRDMLDSTAIETKKLKKGDELLSAVLQKEYPNISSEWKKKIEKAFVGIDQKDVIQFLRSSKSATKWVPQSMVATALIEYGTVVAKHGWKLSVSDYKTHLEEVVAQHKKLQALVKVLDTNKDTSVDFQKFKKSHPKNYWSLTDIQQSKWFTYDTYIAFQYLTSKQFQDKKSWFTQSLSNTDRSVFDAYIQSDQRIARRLWVESGIIWHIEAAWVENKEYKNSSSGTSFENVYDRFSADFEKPQWPARVVDTLFMEHQDLFGSQWLGKDQKDSIRSSIGKSLQDDDIKKIFTDMLQQYPQQSDTKLTSTDMVEYCKNIDTIPSEKKDVCQKVFDTYIENVFLPQTKNTVKYDVMKEYFGYVSWLLKAWGEVVTMDTTEDAIVYEKDGTITMKYHTQTWLEWEAKISADWKEVTITDFFAQHGDTADQTDNPLIIQKRQRVLMWSMPSMYNMIAKSSTNIEQHTSMFVNKLKNPTSLQAPTHDLVSQDEQVSYNVLTGSMAHVLQMTQYADHMMQQIGGIENQYNVTGVKNDLSAYVHGDIPFLDRNTHKDLEAVFVMRDMLQHESAQTVEKCTHALEDIYTVYQWLPKEQQLFVPSGQNLETTPVDWSWKISFQMFLLSFCGTNGEFSVDALIRTADYIQKNKPQSFPECWMELHTYFPQNNKIIERYPQISNLDKEYDEDMQQLIVAKQQEITELHDPLDQLELWVKMG